MTFKNNWEKTTQYFQLEPLTIQNMLELALPNQKPFSYEIVPGGCANLNIKFTCEGQSDPLLLRIYLRDKDASYREQQIAVLVNGAIPVPDIYFVGDLEDYRFSITEYKNGISLRELLLNGQIENLEEIMMECGSMLAKIQSYRFSHSGFFDKDLNIGGPMTQNGFTEYAKESLKHPTTIQQISKEDISKIDKYLDKYHSLFPDENENHLVHADYDPANILVQHGPNGWKISAILDWEFAFSGSTLCDVANMLRYAHHMPRIFEEAFLHGLQQGGVILPENWRISVFLLNLLSLLDCLQRCPPDIRPNQCADIKEVISFIIQKLDELQRVAG